MRRLTKGRARYVPVTRLQGAELVRIGGGDLLPTPIVPTLPTAEIDRQRGLCGDTLALPAANVRLLRDVRICVGENLVRMADGSVVVNNPTSERLGRPARSSPAELEVHHDGTAALYGSPLGAEFESLVADIAPVVLLQHPALHGVAPITVVGTGSRTLLEGFLLARAANRQVRIETVPAGTVLEPDRTAFPAPVTRESAGAVPRWFRRWVDQQAASVDEIPVARRLVLTHGPGDPLLSHPEIVASALEAGFTHVDTLSGQVRYDGTLDAEQLVATLHGSSVVVAASDEALAATLLCKRAEVLQLQLSETVSPRAAQLAASKALPYRLLLPDALPEAVASV